MSDKPLLPIKQYAARVGMARHQAYAAVAEGKLPNVRLGKAIMIPVRKADRALGISQEAPALPVAAE